MSAPRLGELGPPVPITALHDLTQFHCRHDSLTVWLQRRALVNTASGATRTYVVCSPPDRVVGYYALAAGSLDIASAPTRMRRNMPDPLPLVVLGRLAVDDDFAGQGIGSGLLKDAILRSLKAAEIIGSCALLCHAIDADAKVFYAHHGFVESPTQSMTMMLALRG